MTTTHKVKAAIIRRPGYLIGQPAPCYLNCSCGAQPTATEADAIPCVCGAIYSPAGWLLDGRV